MRLTRDGWFGVLVAWTAVAGSLLGNGVAAGVPWLIGVGTAMSALCPAGVIVVPWVRRRRW